MLCKYIQILFQFLIKLRNLYDRPITDMSEQTRVDGKLYVQVGTTTGVQRGSFNFRHFYSFLVLNFSLTAEKRFVFITFAD